MLLLVGPFADDSLNVISKTSFSAKFFQVNGDSIIKAIFREPIHSTFPDSAGVTRNDLIFILAVNWRMVPDLSLGLLKVSSKP